MTETFAVSPEPYPVKRRHTRIFFGDRDKISGIMSTVEDQETSFSTSVLNLSEGGLQFSQKRQGYKGLQPEDKLIMRRIIGIPELVSLADIPLQIVWVMDNEYLDHVVMGVAFIELTESQRQSLRTFVDTCLALHRENQEP